MTCLRRVYEIEGVVQGVGFRPTIYRLAQRSRLGGTVQNCAGRVTLVLEGAPVELAEFIARLPEELPPQARIDRIILSCEEAVEDRRGNFTILPSTAADTFQLSFPPDLAICGECRDEIGDPANRRFGYAFTTCTNCGPRYTVIDDLPYDRERTTLRAFPLCAECRKEYRDPGGRRFHAESIACPECGPRLWLADWQGSRLRDDPLSRARQELRSGRIVALRGVGGFLLAVDAFNREAISRLRARKRRPHKPLAVMARDLTVVEKVCEVSEAARAILSGPGAPIVILDVRKDLTGGLPLDLLAGDSRTLGVMLPNSPLHWLLFTPLAGDPADCFDLLVMTSGNRRGEPICLDNQDAFDRLSGLADYYLCHDREINLRADDSVCVVREATPQMWRRGRGFAPGIVGLKKPLAKKVLALGAEMKNAIAFGYGAQIVMSAHIGDLDTPEALAGLNLVATTLPRFLREQPEVVAVDLHPDFHSSRLGCKLAEEQGIPTVRVQHHVAHAAACLAEHGEEECLALVFDGTGLGVDGNIWGAELLEVNRAEFRRLGSFAPVPLPGGDAAVMEPVRQLVGRLVAAGVSFTSEDLAFYQVTDDELLVWSKQCQQRINAPLSHAAGRLFDAFAALLGITERRCTYDGQAAVALEALARQCSTKALPDLRYETEEQGGYFAVDWSRLITSIFPEPVSEPDRPVFALAFHHAVAKAAWDLLAFGLDHSSVRKVVLSGGVFMNRILVDLVSQDVRQHGLRLLTHHLVPPNDGGVAVGQAYLVGR